MHITVAYATREKQVEISLEINEDATVESAIQASGIFQIFSEIDLTNLQVGIFGNKVSLSDSLFEHDRIEIYRPLQVDPKEARRLRAKNSPRKKNSDSLPKIGVEKSAVDSTEH
jgi:putative ubiquitin-RnfH superfamily antitoxin RatB of RatAB toxin-antitoxin module